MSSYYANTDLDAYADQLANYDSERDAWQLTRDRKQAEYDEMYRRYEEAHAAWEANPTTPEGDPLLEPLPPEQPTFPDEPTPPAEPSLIYDTHDVTEPEQITTATGPALVLPGRVVASFDGGVTSFALTPDELAAGYTLVSEPLPLARER